MEPYKRLLDRRWDDLSARITLLEQELEDTKRTAAEARAKGGRVETEIIVTVRNKNNFFFLFQFICRISSAVDCVLLRFLLWLLHIQVDTALF